MKAFVRSAFRLLILLGMTAAFSLSADDRVVVVASADSGYVPPNSADGAPPRKTYVVMTGRYFAGPTDDPALQQTSFRQIVTYLKPQLAKQHYVPARSRAEADLMLVVHWGVTTPRLSITEMAARSDPSPRSDDSGLEGSAARWDNLERTSEASALELSDYQLAQLLGYRRVFRKAEKSTVVTPEELSLRDDLRKERYFIIVRAYDLRLPVAGKNRLPVWSLHLNVASAGNDFTTALARMIHVAPAYFGRTSKDVETIRTDLREVKVELGDLILVGEAR